MSTPGYFVLVVDADCRRGRSLVSRLKDAGCYAAGTWKGEDALGQVLENEPDAVVSEWQLDDMSGLELLREIKERSFRTKVILSSDHADWRLLRRTLESGGDDLLGRPFTPEQVLRAVGRSLEPVHGRMRTIPGASQARQVFASSLDAHVLAE